MDATPAGDHVHVFVRTVSVEIHWGPESVDYANGVAYERLEAKACECGRVDGSVRAFFRRAA